MRVSYSTLVKAKRAGRATSVRVSPTGTAVTDYQIPLGQRHSLKEAGVVGMPSWSEKATQNETWVKVPRLSATCPRRVVAFDGGKGNIDKTMEFGDDFDGGALNTSKWTPSVSGSGAVIVSGGNLTITVPNTSSTVAVDSVVAVSTPNTIWRARFAVSMPGSKSFVQNGVSNPGFALVDIYDATTTKLYTFRTAEEINTGNAGFDTLPHTYELKRIGTTSVVMTKDGGSTQTNSTQVPIANQVAHFSAFLVGNTGTVAQTIAYVAIRKYAANEPLAGTAKPSATNRALSRPMRKADLMRACCT